MEVSVEDMIVVFCLLKLLRTRFLAPFTTT